jgi:hypothetical protein
MDPKLPHDVSAQVLLNPAGLSSSLDIVNWFQRAGFDVGPLLAKSFSITASPETFEHRLGVHLETTPEGQVYVAGKSGPAKYELPLDRLDATIAGGVELIVFTPLPDFGPGRDF